MLSKEYQRLSEEEKTELNQWRNKSPKKSKPDAKVADATVAALESKVDKQHNILVAAMNALTSAISLAIPGAKASCLQAMGATEGEVSPQPAGEDEVAEAGQISATGGDDDTNLSAAPFLSDLQGS